MKPVPTQEHWDIAGAAFPDFHGEGRSIMVGRVADLLARHDDDMRREIEKLKRQLKDAREYADMLRVGDGRLRP